MDQSTTGKFRTGFCGVAEPHARPTVRLQQAGIVEVYSLLFEHFWM